MPESLPDRLAKAMLDADDRGDINEWYITEALVPAVLAALTVQPDGQAGGEPFWVDTLLGTVTPATAGGEVSEHQVPDATPDELEHTALVLLSVAQEMRKHSAWTGE